MVCVLWSVLCGICSVYLPYGAVCLTVFCHCGVSWSLTHFFLDTFLPDGLSQPYQLDESISIGISHLYLNFDRIFCTKNGDLGLHRLPRMLGVYGLPAFKAKRMLPLRAYSFLRSAQQQ